MYVHCSTNCTTMRRESAANIREDDNVPRKRKHTGSPNGRARKKMRVMPARPLHQAPSVYLPRNILIEIAKKANKRTQARMKVLNKAMLANARLPSVLKQGYVYGTGKYQREYNQLWRRLHYMDEAFRKQYTRDDTLPGNVPSYLFFNLKNFFKSAKQLYVKSKKAQRPVDIRLRGNYFRRDLTRFEHMMYTGSQEKYLGLKHALGIDRGQTTIDPEEFMDRVILAIVGVLGRKNVRESIEQTNVSPKDHSRKEQAERAFQKILRHGLRERAREYQMGSEGRRRARVLRRAARRV